MIDFINSKPYMYLELMVTDDIAFKNCSEMFFRLILIFKIDAVGVCE